jgi:hypothetical protein
MPSVRFALWSGRVLACIFILAGASKISFPFTVNPSFLKDAVKVTHILLPSCDERNVLMKTTYRSNSGSKRMEQHASFRNCLTPPPPTLLTPCCRVV